jgi:acid stress chaperone HdeB
LRKTHGGDQRPSCSLRDEARRIAASLLKLRNLQAGKAMHGGVTVKARLLLISALLMLVQIPAPQAQVTVDVVKITCQQLLMQALPWTSRDIVLWLSGYYHGKHDNTIIEPNAVKRDEDKLDQYCFQHGETTVMDAVKNMGLGK